MNYKGNALATRVPFRPDAEREPVDFKDDDFSQSTELLMDAPVPPQGEDKAPAAAAAAPFDIFAMFNGPHGGEETERDAAVTAGEPHTVSLHRDPLMNFEN